MIYVCNKSEPPQKAAIYQVLGKYRHLILSSNTCNLSSANMKGVEYSAPDGRIWYQVSISSNILDNEIHVP